MSLEEEMEEERELEKRREEIYQRLTLLDKAESLSRLALLTFGAYPEHIEGLEFLIVKVKNTYFSFVKEGQEYFKW